MLKVLVVGSGGREHAIVWKLAQSPRVSKVYVAPGNAGMSDIAQLVPIGVSDIEGLTEYASRIRPDVTIVGPEIPLAMGLADSLRAHGLCVFGPGAEAARIESSKVFAKKVMERAGIPTARYEAYSDYDSARDAASSVSGPIVVKLDGLAAGKGVIVAEGRKEAVAAVDELAASGSGARIILEEKLEGVESSIICISDGADVCMMAPAMDHKRAFNGNVGPNTGGMGAVARMPEEPGACETLDSIRRNILLPAVATLRDMGAPFVGALFAGLMITEDGPRVLEFNCRFGDPETQAIMPLLETDLVDLVEAACHGHISEISASFKRGASVGVVMVTEGYPTRHVGGGEICIPTQEELGPDVIVFHSGTMRRPDDGALVATGGRALTVTGIGADVREAQERAYGAARGIHFQGSYMRSDIGDAWL